MHGLVREAAQLALPASALGVNQRMVEPWLAYHDAQDRVAEVAFHALESLPVGEPATAVLWAVRAAAQAMAQLAWEEAAGLYDRVLDLGAELTVGERCRLLVERARTRCGPTTWTVPGSACWRRRTWPAPARMPR